MGVCENIKDFYEKKLERKCEISMIFESKNLTQKQFWI